MAANDESTREISNLAGQDSSARPERAAAQLCQLKIRFEFSQQSTSTPVASMPAAASKQRFEAPTESPLATGSCLPSVEALLAATVSRVESAVASELEAAGSVTTKLLDEKNMATQVVTSPVSTKFRSKDVVTNLSAKSQPSEIDPIVVLSRVSDQAPSVQAIRSSSSNDTVVSAASSSNQTAPPTPPPPPPLNVICETTPDLPTSSANPSKVLANQAKSLSPNSQLSQLFSLPACKAQNEVMLVHGSPARVPIVYIDDYMNDSKVVEVKNDSYKLCSSPGGSRSKPMNDDPDASDRVQRNGLETTSSIARGLKRPTTDDELPESASKKQSLLVVNSVRKKEIDSPVLSPVMKDSIDSPGSPMTRSMSRRIEESTTLPSDFPTSKPVIPVDTTCSGSASSSENEESATNVRLNAFPHKKVQFNKVSLYLFEREQGFTSVPSEGGSTLGMGAQHLELQEYSIEEYAEIKRLQWSLNMGAALPQGQDIEGLIVQPVPTRRRRELLRQSGVRNIDALEKEELQMIRVSREQCGCSCMGQCLPGSCLCLELGIECQVDHGFYPCGCTVEGCSNPSGRHEFNRKKVKIHVKATCARANRELGACLQLPEMFEDVITPADSPDHFGSQEEVYTSSECSENSDYSLPEDALMEELDSLPDSTAEEMEEGLPQKQRISSNDASISEESDTATEMAREPSLS